MSQLWRALSPQTSIGCTTGGPDPHGVRSQGPHHPVHGLARHSAATRSTAEHRPGSDTTPEHGTAPHRRGSTGPVSDRFPNIRGLSQPFSVFQGTSPGSACHRPGFARNGSGFARNGSGFARSGPGASAPHGPCCRRCPDHSGYSNGAGGPRRQDRHFHRRRSRLVP